MNDDLRIRLGLALPRLVSVRGLTRQVLDAILPIVEAYAREVAARELRAAADKAQDCGDIAYEWVVDADTLRARADELEAGR